MIFYMKRGEFMYVTDLEGNDFMVQATTSKENEVNGNQKFSGEIKYNKVNSLFLKKIDRLWEIYDHDDVGYKIITLNKQGVGDKLKASFTAIPLFFDYMDTNSIMDDNGDHYRYDGSLTAFSAFSMIFSDTPFTFVIVDNLTTLEWQNFGGGESKLETFKRCLERYQCEFRIVGSTIYLEKQIGRDTSIQYRHKLNASNIVQEIDASAQYTAIRGYGNFGDGEDYQDAKLKRDYVSPLANILGKRYSPPFIDGRVKVQSEMDRKLKIIVDESLKVSISAGIVNLSKQGYPIDSSQVGDRVFVIDERINFNEEVRIVSQSITRDWKGNVIDASVTFGNEGLGKRHQSTINTAVKNITDVFEGRKQLPLSSLDKRVQEISDIINGNTNSVFRYTHNGVIGWNGDDSNYVTRYVGDAIGFSKDGGQTFNTAMSADLGIVADYITTGTLRSIIIDSVEIYGSEFFGGKFTTVGGSSSVEIKDGVITTYLSEVKTSTLTGTNHSFFRDDYRVGNIGTSSWATDKYYRALSFQLAHDADYMHWGYESIAGSGLYDTILSWHKTDAKDRKGLQLNDYTHITNNDLKVDKSIFVGDKVKINSSSNAARFGVDDNTYLVVTDDGQVGLQHNGTYRKILD